MSEFDQLADIAGTCVEMTRADFGRELDFSLASLHVLDLVCGELRETGWGDEEHAEQWWQGVGCYFGEVLVRQRGGEWIDVDGDHGPYAVRLRSATAYPFEAAAQALTGDGASLAALANEPA